MKGSIRVDFSEHTNALSGKVFEPEDNYDGLVISFYLAPDYDMPSMNFLVVSRKWWKFSEDVLRAD